MGVEGGHSRSVIVEEYLKALKRRRYSPKTITTYRYPLQRLAFSLAARGISRLQDVGSADLEAWRLELVENNLADASLEVFLRAARNLFAWMQEQGMLFDNPAASLKTPRYTRRLLPVPSETELRRLLAQPNVTRPVGIRDRALLEVGYSCALRREELARLTLRDVDFLQRTLRVLGKGSRERMLPLGDEAFDGLRRYVEEARPKLLARSGEADALWIAIDGKPLGGEGIRMMMKQHARAAKLSVNVTPHTLRRACATHMLQRGAHPVQIQMLLGHASMRHLGQYLRLTITDIKAMHAQTKPGQ